MSDNKPMSIGAQRRLMHKLPFKFNAHGQISDNQGMFCRGRGSVINPNVRMPNAHDLGDSFDFRSMLSAETLASLEEFEEKRRCGE